MPTHIVLLKWTPQGLQTLKESPARREATRKGLEGSDVRLKEFYMLTGRFDMIAICEAPAGSGAPFDHVEGEDCIRDCPVCPLRATVNRCRAWLVGPFRMTKCPSLRVYSP